jgi:class 3 adenylate cyclase
VTAAELARAAGTSVDRVERLAELGLLERRDGDDPFRPEDLHRVRLADALDRAGIPLEDMGRAAAAGALQLRFVGEVIGTPASPYGTRTLRQVAGEAGIPFEVVTQMWANWSLPALDPDEPLREDDAAIVEERARLHREAGLDWETMIAATRFFGESLRRLTASQVRFFRTYVIDRMREQGAPSPVILERIGPMAAQMQDASSNLRAWLYARHFESQVFQESVELVEEAMRESGFVAARTTSPPAIAFLDLGGYTRLTEEAGDEAAAGLAAGLSELVHRASGAYEGEAVKLLGDGIMFHFRDPAQAVASGLDLVVRAEELGLPPARLGINAGPVVFRDGDYFGRTVNVAARIADYARPKEVLVSAAVVEHASGEAAFEPIGEIVLKGLSEPVSLLRALSP